jgi:transketolase
MPITETRAAELTELCRQFRIDVLKAINRAQSGHCGGSLSVCEILTLLYQEKAHLNPQDPNDASRDRIILGKGHAAPMLYRNLAELGYFPKEDLDNLRQFGCHLQGHPSFHTPGVEMPSGPLGVGLGAAQGMALGLRLQKNPAHVYAVLGDGEINEGTVWETAMSCAKYGLDNLTAILDYNKVQLDGTNDEVMPLGDVEAKWASFGWNVLRCDGHSIKALSDTLDIALAHKGQPTIIIADTIKGKGVSFMEGKSSWHGAALSDENLSIALKELEG